MQIFLRRAEAKSAITSRRTNNRNAKSVLHRTNIRVEWWVTLALPTASYHYFRVYILAYTRPSQMRPHVITISDNVRMRACLFKGFNDDPANRCSAVAALAGLLGCQNHRLSGRRSISKFRSFDSSGVVSGYTERFLPIRINSYPVSA